MPKQPAAQQEAVAAALRGVRGQRGAGAEGRDAGTLGVDQQRGTHSHPRLPQELALPGAQGAGDVGSRHRRRAGIAEGSRGRAARGWRGCRADLFLRSTCCYGHPAGTRCGARPRLPAPPSRSSPPAALRAGAVVEGCAAAGGIDRGAVCGARLAGRAALEGGAQAIDHLQRLPRRQGGAGHDAARLSAAAAGLVLLGGRHHHALALVQGKGVGCREVLGLESGHMRGHPAARMRVGWGGGSRGRCKNLLSTLLRQGSGGPELWMQARRSSRQG